MKLFDNQGAYLKKMLYSKCFQKRSTFLSALNCPTTVMKNVKIRLILLLLTAKSSMLKAAKPRIKFLRCYGLHNYYQNLSR